MALRIAGMKKPATDVQKELANNDVAPDAAPAPEPMDDSSPPEDVNADPMQGENASDGDLMNQEEVHYKGPDLGPFMCSACKYFSHDKPNTCAIVSGYIDEAGICDAFKPLEDHHMSKGPSDSAQPEGAEEQGEPAGQPEASEPPAEEQP